MSHLEPKYLYIEFPEGTPSEEDESFAIYESGRLLFENQVNGVGVNLMDRRDLVDGRRVYRIARKDQSRLPRDGLGRFLWDPRERNGKFRFTEVDPSNGATVFRNWTNFRT